MPTMKEFRDINEVFPKYMFLLMDQNPFLMKLICQQDC
jgi:hypothetical protein